MPSAPSLPGCPGVPLGPFGPWNTHPLHLPLFCKKLWADLFASVADGPGRAGRADDAGLHGGRQRREGGGPGARRGPRSRPRRPRRLRHPRRPRRPPPPLLACRHSLGRTSINFSPPSLREPTRFWEEVLDVLLRQHRGGDCGGDGGGGGGRRAVAVFLGLQSLVLLRLESWGGVVALDDVPGLSRLLVLILGPNQA